MNVCALLCADETLVQIPKTGTQRFKLFGLNVLFLKITDHYWF